MRIEQGMLDFVDPRYADSRSQDLDPVYYDSGQFYCFRVEPALTAGSVLTSSTAALRLDSLEAQNIDTDADWALAEWKFQRMQDAA